MKIFVTWLGFLMVPLLVTIARGDELQIQQYSDPKHPGMVAWKVDYVLPDGLADSSGSRPYAST
jgi:hypothetical protein